MPEKKVQTELKFELKVTRLKQLTSGVSKSQIMWIDTWQTGNLLLVELLRPRQTNWHNLAVAHRLAGRLIDETSRLQYLDGLPTRMGPQRVKTG